MAHTHIRSWSQTPAQVVGVCSRTMSSAVEFAGEYGIQPHQQLADLLLGVDVLDICTPTDQHYEQALAAFNAGKHVVCEKPLARTVDEATRMIDAAGSAGCQLHVAHVLRWFEPYAEAHSAVSNNRLGVLRHVNLMRRGPHPPPSKPWFSDLSRSGGVMLDLLIHDLDYARWMAGEVDNMTATFSAGTATIIMRHLSGVVTHIRGDWLAEVFETSAELIGSAGSIVFSSRDRKSGPDPYVLQAREIYDGLANGAPVRVTARDGLEALRLALHAIDLVQ